METSLTSSGGGREGKNWWSLETSTARSTAHWGQTNLVKPWGTLRSALQLAQGSCILVGSMPWAGTWCMDKGGGRGIDGGSDGGGGGSGGGGRGLEWALTKSSGGNIWGNWQDGQKNSVWPGATTKTSRQPAQRTWTPEPYNGGGCGGANDGGTGDWVIL